MIRKLEDWLPRYQRCIYLGFSPDHAKEMPPVLNPVTGSITAQWNVVFDDCFAIISSSEQDLPDFNVEDWSNMFGATTYHVPDEIPSEEEPGHPDDAPQRDTIATNRPASPPSSASNRLTTRSSSSEGARSASSEGASSATRSFSSYSFSYFSSAVASV